MEKFIFILMHPMLTFVCLCGIMWSISNKAKHLMELIY